MGRLGVDPTRRETLATEARDEDLWKAADPAGLQASYQLRANQLAYGLRDGLLSADVTGSRCLACCLNQMTPNPHVAENTTL